MGGASVSFRGTNSCTVSFRVTNSAAFALSCVVLRRFTSGFGGGICFLNVRGGSFSIRVGGGAGSNEGCKSSVLSVLFENIPSKESKEHSFHRPKLCGRLLDSVVTACLGGLFP